MTQTNHTEFFVQQLTANQNKLYGYVYSLLGDHSRTADVVQETNLVLWRKIEEFDPERPFLHWAFAVARYQIMAHLRDRKRDRILLDAELVTLLSAQSEQQAEQLDTIREALRCCIQRLPPENQQLIESRYFKTIPIAEVAASLDRTAGAIKVSILRIRKQLAQCIQKRMAMEE